MSVDMNIQMEKLAEANVRMVFLTDAYEQLRQFEKELFSGGDIEVFYELFMKELVSLFNADYGALAIMTSDEKVKNFVSVGSKNKCLLELNNNQDEKYLSEEISKLDRIIRLDNITGQTGYKVLVNNSEETNCLMSAPLSVKAGINGAICLIRNSAESFSASDEEIIKLVVIEIEHVLERRILLSQLAKKNILLQKEKKEQEALHKKIGDIQNQLMQSDKMASIGQLAAGVAHEINNPVGYINSNISTLEGYANDLFGFIDNLSEILKSKKLEDNDLNELKEELDYEFIKEDLNELLTESKDGINRVIKIVKDLKDFSHVDEEEWQWANLEEGVDSTLNVVNNEIKYKADIIKEYGEIPEVECIASQLNQVFMNLLVNAAHAIEDKGTITIRTGKENENIWISIIDTGSGIEEKNLNKLFEPFFSTKPVGEGTGLGLSLSYGIIQKHSGKIEVKSELNKGTEFKIILPVNQQENKSKS